MKKNWTIAALILVFVLAWDVFVLRPYNLKNSPAKTNPQVSSEPVPARSGVNTSPKSTDNKVSAVFNKTPETSPKSVRTLDQIWSGSHSFVETKQLNEKTSVSFFSGGRLGALELSNYTVRGEKERKPVSIAQLGFGWSSNNPKIDACLAGFQKPETFKNENGTDETRYFNTTEHGKCQLNFKPQTNTAGLFFVSLVLDGFVGESGSLDFLGADYLGMGPSTDHNFLMARIEGSKKTYRDKDLFESKVVDGKIDWTAWGDRYFVSALLQQGNWNPFIKFSKLDGSDEKNPTIVSGFTYPLALSEGKASYELGLYLGTRDSETLGKIRPDLIEAVDLGFFGSIARLLLWALSSINKLFNNFGVSIIILTLLVRLMFWPLNKKVYESGAKMKALQPEIEKLKAKYGNDKSKAQEMNMQLWNLYRQNKVNPLGSCFPLLLQMPIFFALYGALNHSLDLYQAPFAFWIQDLSSKDPFYVLPILWTASLLAYIKINPTQGTQPGAPDMKWIMIAMNLFIGFLSIEWPSGLTLYLFVSNAVGITQQVLMQRGSQKLQPVQEGV